MGSLSYGKWDALDSDDDGPPKAKAQPVRKQAVIATRESELERQAEESRLAAAELERLQERAEKLQRAMEQHRQQMLEAGESDVDSDSGSSQDADSDRQAAGSGRGAADEPSAGDRQPADLSSKFETPPRRRRMDREWEVQEERIFEARPAPDGGRGQTIVAEFRSAAEEAAKAAQEGEEPQAPEAAQGAAAAGEASAGSDRGQATTAPEAARAAEADKEAGKKKPSLRRLKQLDQELATAVQRECGMDLSKTEAFRLIMDNRGSHLKKHTSVLVLAAGDKFLCPEPGSKPGDGPTSSASSSAAAASSMPAPDVAASAPPETPQLAIPSCDDTADGAQAPDATQAADDAERRPPAGGAAAAEGALAPCCPSPSSEEQTVDDAAQEVQAAGGNSTDDAARPAPAAGGACSDEAAALDAPGAGGSARTLGEDEQGAATAVSADAAAQEPLAGSSEVGRGGAPEYAVASADAGAASAEEHDAVEVELRFFRATPRLGALAKKVGKVPALHVGITTSDGLHQALEFIGVHQRKYYAEEPPSDAISQNLTESLLRVALEFVFHPSRSKYAKRRLVLRECSTSVEALRCRDDLLPRMVEKIQSMSKTIEEVQIEHCAPGSRSRIGTDGKKDRAFLVVDEDALKVAPVEKSISTAPPAAKSFRGLGKGFLNTSEAKKRGLSDAAAAQSSTPDVGEAASSSTAPAPSAGESAALGERTRINPLPESEGPPLLQTDARERAAMILPAADLYPDVPESVREKVKGPPPGSSAEAAVGAAAEGGAAEPQEEPEPQEDQATFAASLSALADQLFGELAQEEEEPEASEGSAEEQTVSTQTPSPTAALSRDGSAASERPERADAPTPDEAGSAGPEEERAPAAGLRLLQQRRRGRGEVAQAPEPPPAPAPAKDESEDLVNLWMKQRW